MSKQTTVPPHSLDSEAAMVGCFLIDPAKRHRVPELNEAHFYDVRHRRIFRAINAGDNSDVAEVAERLKGDGGSPVDVTTLLELAELGAPSPEPHFDILEDYRTRREMRELSRQLDAAAYDLHDPDPKASGLRLMEATSQAFLAHEDTPMENIRVIAERTIATLENTELDGLSTGLQSLDELLGGLPRGELTILAGRPGMGKSAFAQQLADYVARQGHRVLFFSPEMSKHQLALRALANATSINLSRIKHCDLTADEAKRIAHVVAELPLTLVFDDSARTSDNIAVRARQCALRAPVDLIVIDHLQELGDDPQTRNELETTRIGRTMRNLKALAARLNSAMLVVSQLSRASENEKRPPTLRDLRGSGDIEQIAYAAMFLHQELDNDGTGRTDHERV